jgi:UDP-N-acetylglucosamine transferase subunit ALG13
LSPPSRPPRIFVTVGTHEQGFPRVLAAVANVAMLWSERHEPAEWILQAGPATVSLPPVVSHFPSCSYTEILRHLDWADVTVCQSAPGSVFAAIAQRATPIVVPRSRSLGEHVDDHQHAFANHLAAERIATVVTNTELLGEALLAAISEPRDARIERLAQLEAASRKRTQHWSRRVGQEIESLCATSTHGQRVSRVR